MKAGACASNFSHSQEVLKQRERDEKEGRVPFCTLKKIGYFPCHAGSVEETEKKATFPTHQK